VIVTPDTVLRWQRCLRLHGTAVAVDKTSTGPAPEPTECEGGLSSDGWNAERTRRARSIDRLVVNGQPGKIRDVVVATATKRSDVRRNAMNRDVLKGQWTQLKGKVREQWGKLTDDEIDQVQGNAEQFIGKLQERYGHSREQAEKDVDRWLEQQHSKKAS
jgi:uncharacterized protein YjbJ (UPF0337 family)